MLSFARALTAIAAAIAVAGPLALGSSAAHAAEEAPSTGADRYDRVIYDNGTPPWKLLLIRASCEPGYYLDGTRGTPKMSVGKGLEVTREDVATSVLEVGTERKGVIVGDERLVTSTVLEVFNTGASPLGLQVRMFCTTSPELAWRTPAPYPAP